MTISQDNHPGQPQESTNHPASLPSAQIERRLARLDEQIAALSTTLDHLQESTDTQQDQVAALLRAATSGSGTQRLDERLASLVTEFAMQSDQTAQLIGSVQELARTSHVEELSTTLSTALSTEIARQEQLDALENRIAKMVRTQFKANTLSESQMQQLEETLSVLREVAEKRDGRQNARQARDQAQLDEMRTQGRRELVADLLPAMDGLELALQNGQALLQRQQATLAKAASVGAASQRAILPAVEPSATGWWARLLGGAGAPPSSSPLAPAPSGAQSEQLSHMQKMLDEIESWLMGLELAHERFLALLAAEHIQPIDAADQTFDPRLHVAVDTVEDAARSPNTVVRVVRQGYRQRDRILRYAEVVVTRSSTGGSNDEQQSNFAPDVAAADAE